MFDKLDFFRTSMAMARHAGQQQAVSAQNIANADTPGYRALTMPDFGGTLRDEMSAQRATRAGHMHGTAKPGATPTAERRQAQDPNGNTVSLELEMLNSVDAKRQHDRALAIYRSGLSVLRASLGRA